MYNGELTIETAQLGDLRDMSTRLRRSDEVELWELGRTKPLSALVQSHELSFPSSYVAKIDDVPIAAFGAFAPAVGRHASPWMLGTDDIARHGKLLLTMSNKFLAHLLAKYSLLRNVVHAENHQSIRYLEAVGFDIGEPERYWTGAMARTFTMKRENHV